MQERVAWHRLLTARIDDTVKLVGPVISCEGTPLKGDASKKWRAHPHVQSYTLAMDKVPHHCTCLLSGSVHENRPCLTLLLISRG